jgi:hypothetical protein
VYIEERHKSGKFIYIDVFNPNDNFDICVDGWVFMLADFALINDLPGAIDNSSNVIMYAENTSILIYNNHFKYQNGNFNKVL